MATDGTSPGPSRRNGTTVANASSAIPRPRLVIVGTSVIDVITSAGGLSVDRTMAGWQVEAYLPHVDDTVPLRIIGAIPAPLASLTDSAGRVAHITAMAVNVAICDQHPTFRQRLSTWFARDLTELFVWGNPLPLNMIDHMHAVASPISNAAVVFKRQALHAAGTDSAVGRTESFHSGSRRRERSGRPRAKLG